MLDTNAASQVISGKVPAVRTRLTAEPMEAITVSAVTEAELRYGLARRGNPAGLVRKVETFLARTAVLSWDSDVARVHAALRAELAAAGLSLSPLDLLIAAHAKSEHATLVSADRAFARLGNRIALEDWTR